MQHATFSTLFISAAISIVLGIGTLHAATPTAAGTFVTPKKAGTIKFTGIKAVARVGMQGTFNVSGKSYPGMVYAGRPAGTGMVWYYLPNYETNANALLFPQADGSLAGTINFYDRAGNIIDTGTARMSFK